MTGLLTRNTLKKVNHSGL